MGPWCEPPPYVPVGLVLDHSLDDLGIWFDYYIMDPEDLARLVKEIQLSPKDAQTLMLGADEVRRGEERVANCLVVRVISTKSVNREAFRTQFTTPPPIDEESRYRIDGR